jgi:hypothetical protein
VSHERASSSNEPSSVASAALHSNKLRGTHFIRTALKIVSQRTIGWNKTAARKFSRLGRGGTEMHLPKDWVDLIVARFIKESE